MQGIEEFQPKNVTGIKMKLIDVSHLSVIELMNYGFSAEKSIKAAQRFGGNTLEALDFLMSTSDGELFREETITECHRVETARYVITACT